MFSLLETLKAKLMAPLSAERVPPAHPTSGAGANDLHEQRRQVEQSVLSRQSRWRLLC